MAVVDRARFPRDKVCAGWITPGVVQALELEPAAYRAGGLVIEEIRSFRIGVLGSPAVEVHYPDVVSYAIRRCEFDDFLLRRSEAVLCDGTPMTSLRRETGRWIVNDTIDTPVLVGAGGHFCPVARHLMGRQDRREPVVAQEIEFRLNGAASTAGHGPELFFCQDLDGYGWCVRKGDFLNVGIGRRHSGGFAAHRRAFAAFLQGTGRAPASALARWHGHAYLAAGTGVRPLVADGVVLAGDAAGLAWPASGEGIGPAVMSGIAAAEALITADGTYSVERLRAYEHRMRALHPPVASDRPPAKLKAAAGRALLRSPLFARHVVLDRWFLRRGIA